MIGEVVEVVGEVAVKCLGSGGEVVGEVVGDSLSSGIFCLPTHPTTVTSPHACLAGTLTRPLDPRSVCLCLAGACRSLTF